jgi:hypothetical protein
MTYDAPMLITVVRRRLTFLIGVLVTAVVLGVLAGGEIPVVSAVGRAVLGLLWPALALGTLVASIVRRPRTFLVRERTFTTLPSLDAVLFGGTCTVMCVAIVAQTVHNAHRGLGVDSFQITVLVLLLLLFPLQWYTVLGPFGIVLRPDGVLDRQPRGSIFVPWEAGAAAEPTRNGVKLNFARPDLVVRRGFRPGTTLRTGADPGFTARAINLYAARPDFRTAIGTDEGLLRLTA